MWEIEEPGKRAEGAEAGGGFGVGGWGCAVRQRGEREMEGCNGTMGTKVEFKIVLCWALQRHESCLLSKSASINVTANGRKSVGVDFLLLLPDNSLSQSCAEI